VAGDGLTALFATAAGTSSGVGSYAITATLLDPDGKLANYDVTFENAVLTVTPATLRVTADDATRVYGDANPPLTATYSGFVNGDDVGSLSAPLILSTGATAGSNVGTYAITASGAAAANYVIEFVAGTLTVNRAALTVTVDDVTRPYGMPDPAFTGALAGLKNGDAITATYATGAGRDSAPGAYAIDATLLDPTNRLGNYDVTITPGKLTVAKTTITAAGRTLSFDEGDDFGGAVATFTSTNTLAQFPRLHRDDHLGRRLHLGWHGQREPGRRVGCLRHPRLR
jgi:hypothetical protein